MDKQPPIDPNPSPASASARMPGAGADGPARPRPATAPAEPVSPEERARGVAGEQLDGAADAVRRMGRRAREKGGVLGHTEPVAHRVGDGLQDAAEYVREHDVGTMRGDLEGEVRASPIRSLAVAAVVGFVFGRLLR